MSDQRIRIRRPAQSSCTLQDPHPCGTMKSSARGSQLRRQPYRTGEKTRPLYSTNCFSSASLRPGSGGTHPALWFPVHAVPGSHTQRGSERRVTLTTVTYMMQAERIRNIPWRRGDYGGQANSAGASDKPGLVPLVSTPFFVPPPLSRPSDPFRSLYCSYRLVHRNIRILIHHFWHARLPIAPGVH